MTLYRIWVSFKYKYIKAFTCISILHVCLLLQQCSQSYLYLNGLLHRQKKNHVYCHLWASIVPWCWYMTCLNLLQLHIVVSLCLHFYVLCTDRVRMICIYFLFKVLSVYMYLLTYKINAVNMCNKSNVISISVNLICI